MYIGELYITGSDIPKELQVNITANENTVTNIKIHLLVNIIYKCIKNSNLKLTVSKPSRK